MTKEIAEVADRTASKSYVDGLFAIYERCVGEVIGRRCREVETAVNLRMADLEKRLADQEGRAGELEKRNAALETRLAALEAYLKKKANSRSSIGPAVKRGKGV